MSNVEDFLTAEDEEAIIAAIRKAELTTSGEIRVHIERTTTEDPYTHALEIFHFLKMDNTIDRNGVLIYIAVDLKKFVICGDKGIDAVVPDNFWDVTRDKMQEQFRHGKFRDGIIAGILSAGDQLQHYFPWDKNDINELPDDISKG
ncbi:TPM domain-containing protein [Robertkochia solimangrovi]|uniref:TPM domain-containing protein n=1 Tax=Robertkochia solimangrovi TaxID=2213046 RepID=UPI00117FDA60|nr:TPM domain-containing protein [Robertkochia solimangrovi]TRZ43108.1 TPM domain-containing protein [Robertkochia solimangrovi]